MGYPITVNDDGINIKPEIMEKEKLYHCFFKNKLLLLFKDSQDFLNCYEIEEDELVNKIKNTNKESDIEKILENYIEDNNIKN